VSFSYCDQFFVMLPLGRSYDFSPSFSRCSSAPVYTKWLTGQTVTQDFSSARSFDVALYYVIVSVESLRSLPR
jgi:hypothetical protein